MTHDDTVLIHHNPACGTSRNVVAMVSAAGYTPTIVEYLKVGWTEGRLRELMAQAGATPRDFLRVRGTPAADLGLTSADVTDDILLAAMIAHPILVNRPIVVTRKGVRLCRPSQVVFDLLDRAPEVFTKEDGEVVHPRG